MLSLKGADQILSKVAEMREMLGVSSCHHGKMGDVEKQRGEKVGGKKGSKREGIMRMEKKERKEATQQYYNIFTASASFRKPNFKAFYVFFLIE